MVLRRQAARRQRYTKAPSFLSIHMGVRAEVLPPGTECHHICVDAWADMEAPLGTVFVSIPTLLDPGLAPPGAHIVHIFTPDWIDNWKVGLERVSVQVQGSVSAAALISGSMPNWIDTWKVGRALRLRSAGSRKGTGFERFRWDTFPRCWTRRHPACTLSTSSRPTGSTSGKGGGGAAVPLSRQ